MSSPRVPFSPRLVVGLLIAVGGALVLFERSGLLGPGFLSSWWPIGICALGALQLFAGDNPVAKAIGLFLVLLGGALVAGGLSPERFDRNDVWEYAWPAALILLGGSLVFRSLLPSAAPSTGADAGQRVRAFCFWSGNEQRVGSQAFEGGELTAIMGGFELDLRGARIPEDQEAVIDVVAIMGGGAIRVPESWNVHCDVFPFMGGVSDETRSPGEQAEGHLRVRGLAVMGGVEIRN